MTAQCDVTARQSEGAQLGFFERYLTLWVALCIAAGVGLGQVAPGFVGMVSGLEFARVNLPVGLLIWVMIVPMLVKIDFGRLHEVRQHARGIGVTLFVNWAVKPFSMALLGWIFIRHLFAPLLPASQLDSYIAGLILLAAAPCTAMVFVWSNLTKGEPNFTLTQVALNDLIMVFAFAPLVGLLLGVSAIVVPWETLLISVVMYIVVPLAIAQAWRRALLRRGEQAYQAAIGRMGPWSLVALLATLVLLFAFQGDAILAQPIVIALLAGELAGRLAREELAARGSLELARQQAQLNRLVIEEMADGVLVVDRRLHVRAANPAARALLVESPLAISAVAEMSGFASISQFYAHFRAGYGISPHALRTRMAARSA